MTATNSRLERVPEPELMLETDQALAYAEADFEDSHSVYPRLFQERFPQFPRNASVLDLGCGPCDVTWRFAHLAKGWRIDALDGSPAMLDQARRTLRRHRLQSRVRLIQGLLPSIEPPRKHYDVILATSFLHHLEDPANLWIAIRKYSRSGTIVFVADLRRPRTKREAQQMVRIHASKEPEVLQRDFYNSLLAAFTPIEVTRQLAEARLTPLTVETLGDRHLVVLGRAV